MCMTFDHFAKRTQKYMLTHTDATLSQIFFCVCVCVKMIDCGEPDSMIEILFRKSDKSNI